MFLENVPFIKQQSSFFLQQQILIAIHGEICDTFECLLVLIFPLLCSYSSGFCISTQF